MECTLYLASGCNMQCTYCYEGKHDKTSKMSKQTIDKTLNFIIQHNYPGDQIELLFLGGEPLLNKEGLFYATDQIRRRFSYRRSQFSYSITTNGILIDDKCLDLFEKENFRVSISLDGDKATHDLNRRSLRISNVYDIVTNNLKKVQKRNIDFCVRMTITANNVQYLYDNIIYLLSIGVFKIHAGFDIITIWPDEKIRELDKQLNLLDELYLDKMEQNKKYLIDIYDYKFSTFVFDRLPLYCSAGTKNHLVINSNGEIFPCGYVADKAEWSLGTVSKFNSKEYLRPIRRHVKTTSSCKDCPIAFTCCGAKCGFLNFVQTGYLNQHYEQTCKIQKILFEHDYRVIKKLLSCKSQRIMSLLEVAQNDNQKLSNIMLKIMREVEEENKCLV